jgi:glycosyltransferase involved in cell wall biosynthesis
MYTSVIIPVFNGSQTLGACLRALQQQTCQPAEIIVVDDGSTDDTVAIAKQFAIKLLSQTKAGPAAARNYGAKVAQGEILLFTDADCVPAEDWIEQMVAPFTDATIIGAKGVYRTQQTHLVARFVQQEYQDRYDRMVGQAQIDFIDTYSAAYRRDVFLAEGGFDTTFPTASVEDQEFSFRLAERGYLMVYVPQAMVYHLHDRTLGEYMRRKYWIGYWKALVTRRYPAKLAYDSHTPQVLKVQMGLAVLGGGLLGGSTLLTGVKHRLAVVAGFTLWLSLLGSGFTFYQKILRRDRPVIFIAPLLLFIRAWVLGWGFLVGNIKFFMGED